MFLRAASAPLRMASETSLALPRPTPTLPFWLPTATMALKPKRRPPLTTLATRLIVDDPLDELGLGVPLGAVPPLRPVSSQRLLLPFSRSRRSSGRPRTGARLRGRPRPGPGRGRDRRSRRGRRPPSGSRAPGRSPRSACPPAGSAPIFFLPVSASRSAGSSVEVPQRRAAGRVVDQLGVDVQRGCGRRRAAAPRAVPSSFRRMRRCRRIRDSRLSAISSCLDCHLRPAIRPLPPWPSCRPISRPTSRPSGGSARFRT